MPSSGSRTPGTGRHDVCHVALLHWLAHAVIVSQIEAAHLAMAGGPNPDQLLDLPVSWIAKGPGGWPGWCLLLAGSHALLPSLTPHGADQNVIQVTSWPVWPERVSRGETPPPHLPSTGPRSITRRSISGADPQPEGEIPHRTGSKCRRTLRTPLLHVRRRWS